MKLWGHVKREHPRRTAKTKLEPRLLGMELYFDDVPRARDFYRGVLGLPLEEEQPRHHAKFAPQGGFLCLERKGVENYPSQDKAVVFLEVADATAGRSRHPRCEHRRPPTVVKTRPSSEYAAVWAPPRKRALAIRRSAPSGNLSPSGSGPIGCSTTALRSEGDASGVGESRFRITPVAPAAVPTAISSVSAHFGLSRVDDRERFAPT